MTIEQSQYWFIPQGSNVKLVFQLIVFLMWMVLVVVNFCEEEPNPINTDRNEHILVSG